MTVQEYSFFTHFIVSDSIVDTRGTHQLADDNTLCAVDHESTGLCHQRKVAHENLMLIDLVSLLVVKSDLDLQRCRISCISFFALFGIVYFTSSSHNVKSTNSRLR